MARPGSEKPIMIGLYGISGCGKTYLLNQLKSDAGSSNEHFAFYDGSALIDTIVPGGLPVFKRGSTTTMASYREQAISKAADDCAEANKTGVIAGHYMFWDKDNSPNRIGTEQDWATYTHIIYLHVDPDVVASRRTNDGNRHRDKVPVDHLRDWQNMEVQELRAICLTKGILFTSISGSDNTVERLKALLSDIQHHNETANITSVTQAVESAVGDQSELETMLVLDADKTLAPQDTGLLFWQKANLRRVSSGDPLSDIFKTQGYSYDSFRQATLLYEETANDFDTMCNDVAAEVEMYPEMINMIKRVATTPHVGAMVVTCGLLQVWERVLARNGLPHVKIIGGGRLTDGYVVTGAIKGHIVDKLHEKKLRVIAFGDSPLDIDMFCKADDAYVVVGDKATRSSMMDKALSKAVTDHNLSALQVILPDTAEHRLDLNILPKARLDSIELASIFHRRPSNRFVHATDKNAAKLLMTPTRDASNRSHALRKAHERVGYYLAMEYLSSILGLEEVSIQHVQNRPTDGYRFRHEKETLIIPMMRGGEPMAFGVSKAMPEAGFAHAKTFSDVDPKNFKGKRTIILVDSVVNSGKSIVEFVEPLREQHPYVRVIVVAGVVQANAVIVKEDHTDNRFAKLLRDDGELYLVALRKSENSFKGQGQTDTGHRLFNTTRLD